jgi:putative transposase
VSLNPIRAGLPARAQDWRWSSARAHLGLGADGLTDIGPARFAIFADLLKGPADDEAAARPLGSAAFIARLEDMTSRRLRPLKRGPKGRDKAEDRDAGE